MRRKGDHACRGTRNVKNFVCPLASSLLKTTVSAHTRKKGIVLNGRHRPNMRFGYRVSLFKSIRALPYRLEHDYIL